MSDSVQVLIRCGEINDTEKRQQEVTAIHLWGQPSSVSWVSLGLVALEGGGEQTHVVH